MRALHASDEQPSFRQFGVGARVYVGMDTTDSLRSLSDDDLVERFASLIREDHEHTERLLRLLDEIDRREIWAKRGHPSMFDYCVSRFHMSESVASKRIGAARTAHRFPVLFEMIGRGEIHLSAIHRLKAHLTDENHRAVLTEAMYKTIKQTELIAARLAPQPDAPARLRALPRRGAPWIGSSVGQSAATTLAGAEGRARPADGDVPRPTEVDVAPRPARAAAGGPLLSGAWLGIQQNEWPFAGAPPASTAPVTAPRATDPAPLSPGRYKLTVTLDEEAYQAFTKLQGLLAHQVPNGDPAAIVTKALDALLERTMKRKAAITDRPRAARKTRAARSVSEAGKATTERASHETPRKRGIPAAIRRAVWKRDGGKCTFVGEDGLCCGATARLEYAHDEAFAKGGDHTIENIRLRCHAHNDLEAVGDYGRAFMAKKRAKARVRSACDAGLISQDVGEVP